MKSRPPPYTASKRHFSNDGEGRPLQQEWVYPDRMSALRQRDPTLDVFDNWYFVPKKDGRGRPDTRPPVKPLPKFGLTTVQVIDLSNKHKYEMRAVIKLDETPGRVWSRRHDMYMEYLHDADGVLHATTDAEWDVEDVAKVPPLFKDLDRRLNHRTFDDTMPTNDPKWLQELLNVVDLIAETEEADSTGSGLSVGFPQTI